MTRDRTLFTVIALLLFASLADCACSCPECFSTVQGGCRRQENWRKDRLNCPDACSDGYITCMGMGFGGIVQGRQYHYEYLSCKSHLSPWVQQQIDDTGITNNNCLITSAGSGSSTDSDTCAGTRDASSLMTIITLVAVLSYYFR